MPASRSVHLRATFLASLIAAALLWGAGIYGQRLENRYIHALATEVLKVKNQGAALQQDAFSQRDILPLYGSSELVKPIPDKASRFFRKYPTDFTVCPVGKAGTTSLNILEKLSSAGDAARGRKVAISLSPSWFFTETLDPRYYEGNFSLLQASSLAFSDNLDPEVKRAAAQRMLDYPKTVDRAPILHFALSQLASGRLIDRIFYAAALPLGKLEHAILLAQDHYEVVLTILSKHLKSQPHRRPTDLDWDELIARVTRHMAATPQESSVPVELPKSVEPATDMAFRETLSRAGEWHDLELLIRGMKDLGIEPLLLSMPINGTYYDHVGISKTSREVYVTKLRELAEKYGVALVDFEEYEDDPSFLADHHDHLSAKGWMYYNRALDAFVHDRRDELISRPGSNDDDTQVVSSAGT